MKPSLPCKKSEVVCVVWTDAQSEWARHHADSVKSLQPATNRNLGWIVSEDENRVVFANGDSTSGEIDTMIIPRVLIIDILPILAPRKKAEKSECKATPSND